METLFLSCIKYVIILSKYTKNDYSKESIHFYILYHITQFTTQPASSTNYSQYYYDKCIRFANPSVHSHRTTYLQFLQRNLHNKKMQSFFRLFILKWI